MPIPLVTGALIGGGLGLAKGLMNQSRAKKDAELMATQWRTSPWTGMSPTGAVPRGNVLGDVIGGAGYGAMVGQSLGSKPPVADVTEAAKEVAPVVSPTLDTASSVWSKLPTLSQMPNASVMPNQEQLLMMQLGRPAMGGSSVMPTAEELFMQQMGR